MSRFISHLFFQILKVIFFLSLLFLISGLRVFSPYYFDHSKNTILRYDAVEIAIFGHSQSLGGINQFLIQNSSNKITQNFSMPAMPLFYTAKRLDNFLGKNKYAECFIEIGSNQLDSKGTVKNLLNSANTSTYIDLLKKNVFFLSIEDIIFFLKLDFYKTFVGLINGIKSPINLYKGIEYNKSKIEKAYQEKENISKEINKNWNYKIKDLSKGIDELLSVFEKYPECKFNLIIIPEHHYHRKQFNNAELFEKLFLRLDKYDNVEVLNYQDFDFPDNTYYRDFNHLSSKGMNYFTNYLTRKNIFK